MLTRKSDLSSYLNGRILVKSNATVWTWNWYSTLEFTMKLFVKIIYRSIQSGGKSLRKGWGRHGFVFWCKWSFMNSTGNFQSDGFANIIEIIAKASNVTSYNNCFIFFLYHMSFKVQMGKTVVKKKRKSIFEHFSYRTRK